MAQTGIPIKAQAWKARFQLTLEWKKYAVGKFITYRPKLATVM